MLPEFLTDKTLYLIVHIFGAILGAGGAFMSDAIFFKSIKDRVIGKTEFGFMKLGGKLIWTGVVLLVVSGVLLFNTDPEYYRESSKFLVKVTIVGIIILNGAILHLLHLPFIGRYIGQRFAKSESFVRRSPVIMANGAISIVSWASTVVLGMISMIPYGYYEILSSYMVVIFVAVLVSVVARNKILHIK